MGLMIVTVRLLTYSTPGLWKMVHRVSFLSELLLLTVEPGDEVLFVDGIVSDLL